MDVQHFKDRKEVRIEKFPFKGQMRDVTGVSVRWLSSCGDDGSGQAEYGLRYFSVQPGGEIPIHNHFYHQTMYILEGQFECWEFDLQTEQVIETRQAGPGDFVYIPSLVPHGMKNTGAAAAAFLCCIANVYEREG